MMSLVLSLLLAVVTTGEATSEVTSQPQTAPAEAEHDYTFAYKKSLEEDKPLMVVVGAQWCPACEFLKNTTIANMAQTGELDEVSMAVVDRDAEPELAKELMADVKMIPQIIVFTKNEDGNWNRRRLTGYQPIQPVRSLIRRVTSSFKS